MGEEKKIYPEALCQFCQEPVEHPSAFKKLCSCEQCGVEYSLEYSKDVVYIELNAEDEGKEVRVLKNYYFSKENGLDEYGVWTHLVFYRKKECNGAY